MIQDILIALSFLLMGFGYGVAVGDNNITRYLLVIIEAAFIGFLVSYLHGTWRSRKIRREVRRQLDTMEWLLVRNEERGRNDPVPPEYLPGP